MIFHQDLRLAVDFCWKHRDQIMEVARRSTGMPKGQTHMHGAVDRHGNFEKSNGGIDMIYRAISGGSKGGAGVPADSTMDHFRRILSRKLSRKLAPLQAYFLQTQGFQRLNDLDSFPRPQNWIGAFIHFIKNDDLNCTERVYVNLKEATRASAFSAILKKIWHVDGLCSAKVMAPGGQKVDTVVIYCDTPETRNEIIRIIVKYQKRKLSYFGSDLPLFVARKGVGVGHGAEPPGIHPERPNSRRFEARPARQSFNMYRASLLFIALERTEFPEDMTVDTSRMGLDLRPVNAMNRRYGVNLSAIQEQKARAVMKRAQKQDFERRVGEIFRLAGLDVRNPEKQGSADIAAPPPPPPPAAR